MKIAIFIDIYLYSNWKFSATPGLRSSIKISIENLTPVEEDWIDKTIDIDPCIKILMV